MKLQFLGSGSAFTVGDNYHSNMILENSDGRRLLIDCGSDVRHALHQVGLTYADIQDVYISHLHADHVGGLEWLAFTTKFDSTCTKPNVYISNKIVDDLWNRVLSGGLSSLQNEKAQLSKFFNIHTILANNKFIWENTEFTIVPTRHVTNETILVPSHGLMFNADGLKIFITTPCAGIQV